MPVLVRYAPRGLTRAQYHEVSEKLRGAGMWPPDGLIAHVGFGADGDMRVSEVWESPDKLRAFQEHLMPVLHGAGVSLESGPPELLDVEGVQSIDCRYSARDE